MASELLGRGLGLLRPALSLRRSRGGSRSAVLREGRRHFQPAVARHDKERVGPHAARAEGGVLSRSFESGTEVAWTIGSDQVTISWADGSVGHAPGGRMSAPDVMEDPEEGY